MTKIQKKSKSPKKNFLKNEPEVFWYVNAKNEKMWGYRHRYYDDLGYRREKSAQGLISENVATRGLLGVKSDLLDGNQVKVDYSNLTVSEWADIWFETHKIDWKISTIIQRELVIRLHIKPILGKEKLMNLERTTYRRKFINNQLRKYSPVTVRLHHTIFRIMVNSAVEDEIIPRNRFTKIKIKDDEDKEFSNFLNSEELKRFLVYAKHHENITNYTLLLTLAYTGIRRGELMGLKWNNINFEEKTITIERTRDYNGNRDPKSKNSKRIIFIDDLLLNQLKVYRIWCKKIMLTYGKRWSEKDFTFISERYATPITEKTVSEPIKRIIKATGIKSITPHGLRHTHATIMLSKKIPLKTIAERLGNTPEMILRIYGHSLKEIEIESVKVFGDAIDL